MIPTHTIQALLSPTPLTTKTGKDGFKSETGTAYQDQAQQVRWYERRFRKTNTSNALPLPASSLTTKRANQSPIKIPVLGLLARVLARDVVLVPTGTVVGPS